MQTNAELARLFTQTRMSKGLSQAAAASKVSKETKHFFHPAYVSHLETRKSHVGTALVVLYAKTLGIDTETLKQIQPEVNWENPPRTIYKRSPQRTKNVKDNTERAPSPQRASQSGIGAAADLLIPTLGHYNAKQRELIWKTFNFMNPPAK